MERLKKELSTKRNIVIISGAGISTNAGGKFQTHLFPLEGYPNLAVVDDFRSFSKIKMLSRNLFYLSTYCIPKRAILLHNQLLTIF